MGAWMSIGAATELQRRLACGGKVALSTLETGRFARLTLAILGRQRWL